jgi:hypothetical protein
MGYQLQAVIAPADLLRRAARGHAEMHVVDLAQGMALMPMTDALFDQVTVADDETLGFFLLPGGFAETLAAWSVDGSVAYVEADFVGGVGSQTAAVWRGGLLVFGPLHNAAEHPFPADGSPISQALRRMGVWRGRARDEFAAVGLYRHRDHEGWLAEIGVALPEAYS